MELAERLINQHHLAQPSAGNGSTAMPPPATATHGPPASPALAPAPGPVARLTRLEAVRPPLPGAAVALVTLGTARDEAAWVADRIRRLVAAAPSGQKPHAGLGAGEKGAGAEHAAQPLSLDDVAVLYRVNRQVGACEGGAGAGAGLGIGMSPE